MQTFDRLMARANTRHFTDEAAVDRWLTDQHVTDPETRLALKIELAAQGELATDQTRDHRLATDTAPTGSYLQRTLDRIGIRPLARYREFEVDDLLRQARVEDIETRLGVKTELRTRGQLR